MASSSSSHSKPKSCKRRTSSIFTASMRTSLSLRVVTSHPSLYIGSASDSAAYVFQPLRNLPKNLRRRFQRGHSLQCQPLEIHESESALGCPIHNSRDLHVPQLAHTLRFADQIRASRAEDLHFVTGGPVGRRAYSSAAKTVRCICWTVPVVRSRRGLSGAILPQWHRASRSFESFDQLPQRAAVRNLVQAVAGQIHLLAESRETGLPNNSGGSTKPFHTTKCVFQLCRQGAQHRCVQDLLQILSRGDGFRHRSCQTTSNLLTEGLHPRFESCYIDRGHTLLLRVPVRAGMAISISACHAARLALRKRPVRQPGSGQRLLPLVQIDPVTIQIVKVSPQPEA